MNKRGEIKVIEPDPRLIDKYEGPDTNIFWILFIAVAFILIVKVVISCG
jgi:hypothetical protein